MNKITRFPPEPNGYLHIGHCKSIFINWSDNNNCHLRFDDTNPNAEKNEFVTNIIDDIKWLGFDPGKITWTSDYFDILYEYAILLIKNNLAYIDFSSNEKIKEERHNGIESKYRNSSVGWNLEHFEFMKLGKYTKSECVLRLKIDMQNLNHVLRDPIAYRISFTPHHKTGTKWCIYPSYDYSHGIVDALENITHSYCTDEFFIRRDLYYWTPLKLKELGIELEVAQEIEYGKLSVENNILSKRNINRLVMDGLISSYYDPRLLTIKGMRTRGFTPDLIKQIVECSGFDMKETTISTKFINNLLRTKYNDVAIRVFGVIEPVEVHINNFNSIIGLFHPNHPTNEQVGNHQIILSNKIYIEKEDYSGEYIKNYYRFMPGNKVRLRYYNDDFFELDTFDKINNILKIKKTDISNINTKKIKGCIHWISFDDAIKVKYELFTELAPNGTFDPNSKIVKYGFIQKYALDVLDKPIQLERKGFFKFDRIDFENNENIHVFIQIVELNDSKKI